MFYHERLITTVTSFTSTQTHVVKKQNGRLIIIRSNRDKHSIHNDRTDNHGEILCLNENGFAKKNTDGSVYHARLTTKWTAYYDHKEQRQAFYT